MTNISIHTRDFNKNSRSVAKLIDEVLLNGIPDDVPYMEEWLLSQALCKGYNTPEKEAKKALKKHGSENIKQALKLKSRKNYAGDTGASQVYDDLVELAENTGIATHQFAKFLFLKERNTLVRGLVYFFEHASDEEKEHFFTHGYYLEDKDLYVFNVIRILLSDETLKVLFKVLQQFSEKVLEITFLGGENVSLNELDFSKFPVLKDLSVYHYKGTIPESLAKATTLQKISLDGKFSDFPPIFSNLSAMTHLSLSGEFESLPEDILGLPQYGVRLDGAKVKNLSPKFLDIKFVKQENIDHLLKARGTDIPYDTVCDYFADSISMYYGEIPVVRQTLDEYGKTKDAVKSKMRELVMAYAKASYDDEHGKDTNTFWSKNVRDSAPNELVKIAVLLSDRIFLTRNDLDYIKVHLGEQPNFDVAAFIEYVREISEQNHQKYGSPDF